MTSAGAGVTAATSVCDSCHFLDDKMSFLREETTKRGFKTVDGVHMGPCEIHKQHAYTIGPEGSLYACPGFAGNVPESTGHIDGRQEEWRSAAAQRFAKITAWEDCNDCAFIPVCAGGCSAAAHTELGDMNKPNCHKPSFEAGVVTLAHQAGTGAGVGLSEFQLRQQWLNSGRKEHGRERQERHEEKGNASPLAGGRFARPSPVRLHVFG